MLIGLNTYSFNTTITPRSTAVLDAANLTAWYRFHGPSALNAVDGLKVEVDDKFVEHIAEGQDMIIECQDEPTLLGSTSCSSPGTKSIYLRY